MPAYLSNVTLDCSTENFYWSSCLIGALADHCYNQCVQHIDRYQEAVMTKGRQLLAEYDKKMLGSGDYSLSVEANEKLAKMAKEQSTKTLNKVLRVASETMKNGYNRADN